MSALRPFWKFLEARPRPIAVLDEWRQCMGPAFGSVRPILQPAGRPATSYPNPDPHGLPLRVVRHRDGTVTAVCPEGSGVRMELAETDLALFQVDFKRLRAVLSAALGLEVSRATVDEQGGRVSIGSWQPKPSASFPAILVRSTGPHRMGKAIVPLAATADRPTLFLTPTSACWPDGLDDECRRHKCLLVSLDDATDVHDGAFAQSEGWQAYLEAFCRYAELSLPPSFANRRPRRKRSGRAAKIEAVRQELVEHIRSARDHAHSLKQTGRQPHLLKRPTKAELARRADVKDYDVTRCFRDDPQIRLLWNMADDLDQVMAYGR